ncbi:MAG TPA: response regulator [Gemmatimonadales bacterium]|nr:response regulator [Gemmatimonadales bacterium]
MPLEGSRSGHPIAVAIVEDEASVRVGLRRLCESLGLKATVYASGLEFLDSLAVGGDLPDCLLLDAHMPQMTGLELHLHLVESGVQVPTLVYTADDAPEVEARYRASGVSGYLHKPIAGDQLLEAIERAVPAALGHLPAEEAQ